jgi:hypothetical protein
MKKVIFILLVFVFASSASATVYKWVDEAGVVNFTDDYSKVPPVYRESVEEVGTPRMERTVPSQAPPGKIAANSQPTGMARQAPPPIAQTLIREGDFAIKLAEALKIGQAKSEAEAETMLASVGIAPKNGWIADYPVTPDVLGELLNAIGPAADSGKLAMNKDQAIKALQDLTAQQGLPVRAGTESRYAGAEPPVEPPPGDYGEYSRPDVINNYYYNQGPPIVTYYPPPWDYYYMYAWIPYPFWCSGFWFPGFFCLRDFHRFIFLNGRRGIISNHFIDPKTRRVFPIDPATRGTGKPAQTLADASQRRGFASPEAKRGAESIFEHSHERAKPGNSTSSGTFRSSPVRQVPLNRSGNSSSFGGRTGTVRASATNFSMGRSQAGIVPRNMGGRFFSHQGGSGSRSGMGFTRSFAPSTGGSSSRGFHSGGIGRRGSLGGHSRGH